MSGAYARHNCVASSLEEIARASGFAVRREVTVEGNERPADLEIASWSDRRSAAADPTVVHSLNASQDWCSPSTLEAVEAAEDAKVLHYEAACEKAGMTFYPVGMDVFGGYGSRGLSFLKLLFQRYARHSARASELLGPGQLQRECWERVSVALHLAVGRQLARLVCRSGGVPVEESGRGRPSGGGGGVSFIPLS